MKEGKKTAIYLIKVLFWKFFGKIHEKNLAKIERGKHPFKYIDPVQKFVHGMLEIPYFLQL